MSLIRRVCCQYSPFIHKNNFSLAVFGENSRYCYSLGIVIEAQKLWCIFFFMSVNCIFQTRGSIPLYWSQRPNLKYMPQAQLHTANHVSLFVLVFYAVSTVFQLFNGDSSQIHNTWTIFSSPEHGMLSELLWSLTVCHCPSFCLTSVHPSTIFLLTL